MLNFGKADILTHQAYLLLQAFRGTTKTPLDFRPCQIPQKKKKGLGFAS